MQVLVLNYDYTFLNVVSVKKALNYIANGKVTVEKISDTIIRSFSLVIKTPLVVRFTKFVRRVFRRKVPWTKKNVIIRDGFKCSYCGSKKDLTVDHIMPTSRGGLDTFENTVTACMKCNNMKGAKTPREARMSLNIKPSQPTITEFIQKYNEAKGISKMLENFWEGMK